MSLQILKILLFKNAAPWKFGVFFLDYFLILAYLKEVLSDNARK